MSLINTKFERNLVPYYTMNGGDLICPIESQKDVDCALMITEKDEKYKLNPKLNIQLFKAANSSNSSVDASSINDSAYNSRQYNKEIFLEPDRVSLNKIETASLKSLNISSENNNIVKTKTNGIAKTNSQDEDSATTSSEGWFIPEEDDSDVSL